MKRTDLGFNPEFSGHENSMGKKKTAWAVQMLSKPCHLKLWPRLSQWFLLMSQRHWLEEIHGVSTQNQILKEVAQPSLCSWVTRGMKGNLGHKEALGPIFCVPSPCKIYAPAKSVITLENKWINGQRNKMAGPHCSKDFFFPIYSNFMITSHTWL